MKESDGEVRTKVRRDFFGLFFFWSNYLISLEALISMFLFVLFFALINNYTDDSLMRPIKVVFRIWEWLVYTGVLCIILFYFCLFCIARL